MKSEATVQSIFNLFFWNIQNSSLQQFSNLFHSTIAILEYFNKEGKQDKNLKEVKKLFFEPVEELKKEYPELKISKNPLTWSIPQLEWCYFRDTKFKVKLGKAYNIDSRREAERNSATLGEIILILSLFKGELYKKVIEILIEEKLEIMISLPTGVKEIEQLEG